MPLDQEDYTIPNRLAKKHDWCIGNNRIAHTHWALPKDLGVIVKTLLFHQCKMQNQSDSLISYRKQTLLTNCFLYACYKLVDDLNPMKFIVKTGSAKWNVFILLWYFFKLMVHCDSRWWNLMTSVIVINSWWSSASKYLHKSIVYNVLWYCLVDFFGWNKMQLMMMIDVWMEQRRKVVYINTNLKFLQILLQPSLETAWNDCFSVELS